MRLRVILAAPVLLAACATLPEGVTRADVDAFRTAMVNAGCVVGNEQSAAGVEAETGFDEDKLKAIVGHLDEAGEVIFTENGLRLTSGACADA